MSSKLERADDECAHGREDVCVYRGLMQREIGAHVRIKRGTEWKKAINTKRVRGNCQAQDNEYDKAGLMHQKNPAACAEPGQEFRSASTVAFT